MIGVLLMGGNTVIYRDNILDISDRASAEILLGVEYKPRIYSVIHKVRRTIAGKTIANKTNNYETAKGTVTICHNSVKTVLNAYIIDGGRYAQGLLVNRHDRRLSLLLAPKERKYTQSELAEAVDFWESGRENQLFCLYEKSCGAVVFTESNGQRLYLMICMNLGHCGLPKGHVEKFETEREAAIREIYEETGVHVSLIDGFRETVEYPISAKVRKESVYFIGHFDGCNVKIQESEISGYKLCPYEEARSYITHDNDRAIFDNAVKWLEKNYK
jgi:hypothetical protein